MASKGTKRLLADPSAPTSSSSSTPPAPPTEPVKKQKTVIEKPPYRETLGMYLAYDNQSPDEAIVHIPTSMGLEPMRIILKEMYPPGDAKNDTRFDKDNITAVYTNCGHYLPKPAKYKHASMKQCLINWINTTDDWHSMFRFFTYNASCMMHSQSLGERLSTSLYKGKEYPIAYLVRVRAYNEAKVEPSSNTKK